MSLKKILIAVIILATITGVFLYVRRQNQNLSYNPDQEEPADESLNFLSFLEKAGGIDGTKTYIVLFQNAMELRPTGGFIGSFGKITVQNGQIKKKDLFDTGVFDLTLKDAPKPPLLLEKYLTAPYWGTRDANWYFGFPQSTQKFLELYQKSSQVNPNEKIDGVIGLTTNILPFLLEKIGPVTIPAVEGEFTAENTLEKLEFEVEKGYYDRGVEKHERKEIMNELADAILEKIRAKGKLEQLALLQDLKTLLNQKDIQLYFTEASLENYAKKNNWAGELLDPKTQDYLAIVDSNLGGFKTNRCLEYNFDYLVKLQNNGEKPKATLKINLYNTCLTKDFMTTNYHGYLRVFVPKDSQLESTEGFDTGNIDEIISPRANATWESIPTKEIFGNLVFVRLAQKEDYTLTYTLPQDIQRIKDYSLYYQIQPGMNPPHLKVTVEDPSGSQKVLFEDQATQDLVLNQ